MWEGLSCVLSHSKGGPVVRKTRRRGRPKGRVHLRRTNAALAERVREVGPGRVGILAVDSAKRRFAVLLTDFLGKVLMEQTEVENTGPALEAFVERLAAEARRHGLVDVVVGIERTGRYHVPIAEALKPHWTVEMVDPFATQQLRRAADPGNKTEGTDLPAIVRAVAVGLGSREADLPPRWLDWRLVNRAREDLVWVRARARVQLAERIEALLPGYARLFGDLWSAPVGLALAEHFGSAAALLEAGCEDALARLRAEGHPARRQTVERVLAWARTASAPDPGSAVSHALLRDQCAHQRFLGGQILAYEGSLADGLVETPFVLLLSIPGLNVVCTSGYGAELGPTDHYIHPRKITGRAGLFPSRYQSDEVDLPDGPLVGRRNARLRDALIEVAFCLVTCNPYFKGWAEARRARGWPEAKIHVAVATTFARISYHMVAGRQLFDHPCTRGRDAVLWKLADFARRRGIDPATAQDLLVRAAGQLPREARAQEAEVLRSKLPQRRRRGSGLQHIRDILPEVIGHLVESVPGRQERPARNPTPEVQGGLLTRRSRG